MGDTERLCAQEPHRALLGIRILWLNFMPLENTPSGRCICVACALQRRMKPWLAVIILLAVPPHTCAIPSPHDFSPSWVVNRTVSWWSSVGIILFKLWLRLAQKETFISLWLRPVAYQVNTSQIPCFGVNTPVQDYLALVSVLGWHKVLWVGLLSPTFHGNNTSYFWYRFYWASLRKETINASDYASLGLSPVAKQPWMNAQVLMLKATALFTKIQCFPNVCAGLSGVLPVSQLQLSAKSDNRWERSNGMKFFKKKSDYSN